ncbi:S-adenosyl-L-methionine-dependent methyltransferase [Mycena amicta]|nr:S-adenosyl-L-methionine-dependent methyltransferase [Mycena amicta]
MMKPDYSTFNADGELPPSFCCGPHLIHRAEKKKMGEVTGVPAHAMLVQSGLLPKPPSGALVLDNACGGGIVADKLFEKIGSGGELKLVCGDLEEAMVKSVKEKISERGWNAEALVVDAQAIPFSQNHFTHTVMNFGIQVIPDNALAMKETFRILRPGGVLGMTSWIAPGWLDTMLHGCPDFSPPARLTTGPTATKESVTALLVDAGFPTESINVQVLAFEHVDEVEHVVRYMKHMFEREKWEAYVKEQYGEGSLTLTWKALVVTAVKPKV